MPIFDIPVHGFVRVQNDSRAGAIREVDQLMDRVNSITGGAGIARVKISPKL